MKYENEDNKCIIKQKAYALSNHASPTSFILYSEVVVNNLFLTTTGMLVNEKQLFEYNLAFC